jgi:hypothetical protein
MTRENPICPKCDLPDYACVCEPRITTVHGRYHVGHPEHGLINTVSRCSEALSLLESWCDGTTGYDNEREATVYDSMARHHNACLWGFWGERIMILAYRV